MRIMAHLSRKHRPKKFADITGQSHVTETLRKEVASGILGHAFLFSGPRGVGKTTAARILAHALNCEKPEDGEPCGNCAWCTSVREFTSLDIIELDAATHTGIDAVRESIIENVRFSPSMGKRKIYILDEVHMFSTSSWNALLKTLEEPPAYAFFILATTEWHKVPATIISRCQRFEFKRIPADALEARLQFLAKQEGWDVSDDVIQLIVSRADGCARDAETLLGNWVRSASLKSTPNSRASSSLPATCRSRHISSNSGRIKTMPRRCKKRSVFPTKAFRCFRCSMTCS